MNKVYSAYHQRFQYRPNQKHCIFLHGWDVEQNIPFINSGTPPADQLAAFQNDLAPTLKAYGWMAHRIVYPSQLPFPDAAEKLSQYFERLAKQHRLNFRNSVLIGYSTGGLVARSLIADFNFPCTALLTLAAPHMGLLDYAAVAKVAPSVAAMLKDSPELWQINNNRKDISMRSRYRFYGITFTGHFNEHHADDGLVSFESAVGQRLSNIRSRVQIHIPRSNITDVLIHNTEALQPQRVRAFLNDCSAILKRY